MKRTELQGENWLESEHRRRRDRVIAYAGLTALGLPAQAARAAKYMEDGQPVLFMQERVGRNGEPFPMYKLRTMDDIEYQQPVPDAITPVGKLLRAFKLDEVPQFYNVLRGEMSIVGPRPLLRNSFEYMKAMLPQETYDEWVEAYYSTPPASSVTTACSAICVTGTARTPGGGAGCEPSRTLLWLRMPVRRTIAG